MRALVTFFLILTTTVSFAHFNERKEHLTASPESVDFGAVRAGLTVIKEFTLKNNRNQMVELEFLGDALAAPFQRVGGTCTDRMTRRSTCTIQIAFSPTSNGDFLDTASYSTEKIHHRFCNHRHYHRHRRSWCNHMDSIVTVEFRGEGLLPPAEIAINQTEYDFGRHVVGSNTSVSFTLTNTSSTPAENLMIVGVVAPFQATNNCPSTLLPNSNCNFSVLFSPTASGNFSSSLTFTGSNLKASVSMNFSGNSYDALPPGSPDVYFGTDGVATIFTGNSPLINATQLSLDGTRLLSGGFTHTGSSNDFLAIKQNLNGYLENSFGTGGIVTLDIQGDSNDLVRAVIPTPDNGVELVGYANTSCILVKLTSNGSLDPSFNSGNPLFLNSIGDTFCYAGLLDSNSSTLVLGITNTGERFQSVVFKVLPDGNLDTSFNGTGYSTFDIGSANTMSFGITQQADRKILVTGLAFGTSSYDQFVYRMNSDGTVDNSFGTNGSVLIDFNQGNDQGISIVSEQNGKITMAGRTVRRGSDQYSPTIVRLNADGSLDSSFGFGGMNQLAGMDAQNLNASLVQVPTGAYYIAWVAYNRPTPSQNVLRVSKFDTSGQKATAFGNSGTMIIPEIYGKSGQNPGISVYESQLIVSGTNANSSAAVLKKFFY